MQSVCQFNYAYTKTVYTNNSYNTVSKILQHPHKPTNKRVQTKKPAAARFKKCSSIRVIRALKIRVINSTT